MILLMGLNWVSPIQQLQYNIFHSITIPLPLQNTDQVAPDKAARPAYQYFGLLCHL